MKNKLIALLVLFTVIFFSSAEAQTTARKFEAGKNTFLLDGKPFVVKACRVALYPYSASLLGSSHRDVQGVGDEYYLHLHLLEYTRTGRRKV